MKIQIYIDTAKTKLSVKDRLFLIQSPSRQNQISPMRIDSIAITSAVQINTAAIKLAAEHDIPIFIYDGNGKLTSMLRNCGFQKHSNLRKQQLLFMNSIYGNRWAVEQMLQKTSSQKVTLKRYATTLSPTDYDIMQQNIESMTKFAEKIENINLQLPQFSESIMGIEGNIARLYFKSINLIIPQQYRFEERSRRPGKDYFNTALNYVYGITYGNVSRALHAAGLDTYVGALHKTAYQETLVFDFIESFRPIMDRLIIQMCKDELWLPEMFTPVQGGFLLNRNGKKLLFTHYGKHLHQRIKWKQQVTTIENHMFHEARRLKKLIENSQINVSDIL